MCEKCKTWETQNLLLWGFTRLFFVGLSLINSLVWCNSIKIQHCIKQLCFIWTLPLILCPRRWLSVHLFSAVRIKSTDIGKQVLHDPIYGLLTRISNYVRSPAPFWFWLLSDGEVTLTSTKVYQRYFQWELTGTLYVVITWLHWFIQLITAFIKHFQRS